MRALDPDRVTKDVGRRIAGLRRERGLTQAAFSELLGASVQWVSQIEGGGRNLTLHSLVKLANALEVPIATLFESPGPGGKVRRGRPPKA